MTGPWRKSSRSNQAGGDCVEWRRSSRSSGQGGECVEARTSQTDVFQVRDSKLGDSSPIVTITRANFAALVDAVKSGRLDG